MEIFCVESSIGKALQGLALYFGIACDVGMADVWQLLCPPSIPETRCGTFVSTVTERPV